MSSAEYLEDLVTRIDTPQLDEMDITFFNQIDFNCPPLAQFINRSPKLRARDEAHVKFDNFSANVALPARSRTLKIGIRCREERQLSSVAQVCNSFLPLSTVEDLYVEVKYRDEFKFLPRAWVLWNYDANESAQWLQLLLSFTAVKNLYISKEIAPGIAAALQEIVGERITEVLPGLQNIFVEGLGPSGTFQKNIGQFIALRQLSDHPIAISVWTDSKMKPM